MVANSNTGIEDDVICKISEESIVIVRQPDCLINQRVDGKRHATMKSQSKEHLWMQLEREQQTQERWRKSVGFYNKHYHHGQWRPTFITGPDVLKEKIGITPEMAEMGAARQDQAYIEETIVKVLIDQFSQNMKERINRHGVANLQTLILKRMTKGHNFL